jgi:hypothetical protein
MGRRMRKENKNMKNGATKRKGKLHNDSLGN